MFYLNQLKRQPMINFLKKVVIAILKWVSAIVFVFLLGFTAKILWMFFISGWNLI